MIACGCNKEGTESCNKETGQCVCKPNVVGVTGNVISIHFWMICMYILSWYSTEIP